MGEKVKDYNLWVSKKAQFYKQFVLLVVMNRLLDLKPDTTKWTADQIKKIKFTKLGELLIPQLLEYRDNRDGVLQVHYACGPIDDNLGSNHLLSIYDRITSQ